MLRHALALLVLGLSPVARADSAEGATKGQPTKAAPAIELWMLPLQARSEVESRYQERLTQALAQVAPPPSVTLRQAALPEGDERICALAPACLQAVAKRFNVERLAGWVLGARGRDFVVTTIEWNAAAPAVIEPRVVVIKHNELAPKGQAMMQEWLSAMVPVSEPTENPTPEGSSAQLPPELVGRSQPAPSEPVPAVATTDDKGPQAAAEPAEVVPLSAEDLAARAAEAESEGYAAGEVRKKNGSIKELLAGEGRDLRPTQDKKDWDTTWSKRRSNSAGSAAEVEARQQAQKRMLLMGLAGLAAGSLGFFLGYTPAVRSRRRISFESKVDAKEAAMTMAILRTCAKQLTPGVLMSAEFEASKRFCFALVDGNQVSVDVMELSAIERAAFRPGMQLCAQFVHKDGTAMAMMTVLRTQAISPNRLRLVLSAPGRLAEVTRPQGFKIPVDPRTPLLVRALRETEGGKPESWQGRVRVVSDNSLQLMLDEDAFELSAGDRVTLSLRLDDNRAELVGQVSWLSDSSVAFELEDKLGGHPPREYQSLVRKLEGQWLSTLGT